MQSTQLPMGTIIEGPFWPEPLRVLNASDLGASVRISRLSAQGLGTTTIR